MTWTIRPSPAEEAERLLPLQNQVQALHSAARPDIFRVDTDAGELAAHLRTWLSRTDVTALAAVDAAGAVLGYVIYEIERLPRRPLKLAMVRGHLHQIVVDGARRRSGIGLALVTEMMARLRAGGVDRAVVSYYAFNQASAALMRKAGFAPLHVTAESPTTPGQAPEPSPSE